GRLVDQHEAERDQRVHASLRDAGDQQLKNLTEQTLSLEGFDEARRILASNGFGQLLLAGEGTRLDAHFSNRDERATSVLERPGRRAAGAVFDARRIQSAGAARELQP